MRKIRTILVPVDFSDLSVVALHHARALALRSAARIIVTHVLEDRLTLVSGDRPGPHRLGKEVEFRRSWAEESLEQLVERHIGDLLDVERRVAVGVPHVKIADLTSTQDVDWVVMATRGAGFGSRPRRGSTADHVSRSAACPVLIVRDRRTHRYRTAS